MDNLISLVNKIQRACTALGDHGENSALPTLWDSLPAIAVVGGQVRYIYICCDTCRAALEPSLKRVNLNASSSLSLKLLIFSYSSSSFREFSLSSLCNKIFDTKRYCFNLYILKRYYFINKLVKNSSLLI